MTWIRASRLFLILACLVSVGCSGAARSYFERQDAAKAEPSPSSDNEHADLERELSLYSD